MLKTGYVDAEVLDYGVGLTKDNFPQVIVTFKTIEGDNIKWYGSLKNEKARSFTFQGLDAMGFTGDKLSGLGAGKESGLIKEGAKVVLKIGTYNDKFTVEYVNKTRNKFDNNELVTLMEGLNVENEWQSYKTQNGVAPSGHQASFASNDVGF